jgi:hypothetical protein
MAKFNAGDRVELTEDYGKQIKGDKATVLESDYLTARDATYVEFDVVRGGIGKIHPYDFQLKLVAPVRKFQVGNRVIFQPKRWTPADKIGKHGVITRYSSPNDPWPYTVQLDGDEKLPYVSEDEIVFEPTDNEPSLSALLLEVEVRVADLDENVHTEKVAKAEALRALLRIVTDNV